MLYLVFGLNQVREWKVELFQGRYLQAFRMVQRLTYHQGLPYNTAFNKTRLSRASGNRIVYPYTKKVIQRRLGKHQNLPMAYAQADFMEFVL